MPKSNEPRRRSPGGRTSPAAIARAERDQQALELKRCGATYRQIAVQLGVSGPGQAHKMVQRGLTRRLGDSDEELRAIELDRCRAAIARLWPKVDCDDPDPDAFNQLTWWLNYQAKLAGLFAPRRDTVAVEVRGHVDQRIVTALATLNPELEAVIDAEIADTTEPDDDAA